MCWVKGFKYRHKNCLDMDMFILSVKYSGTTRTLCQVAYVAQTNSRVFGAEFIWLENKHCADWRYVSDRG
jgi:hypothetical protein